MPPLPEGIAYPYGTPTITGTTMALDWLVKEPNRITRAIANIALQRFYVDQIFAPSGPIVGGAVIYEQLQSNDLYPNRDIRRVEAGDEFPVVTFERGVPLTAQVEKFGGKFPITDEAVRRNQPGRVTRAIGQLANVINRKIQQRALTELTAAISAAGRTAAGTSWGAYAALTAANRTLTSGPVADITAVEQSVDQLELGYDYDFAIMNPQEWRNLRLLTDGTVNGANALLADSGIGGVWVTQRKSAGTVYWLARQQVGELGYEVGLSTETWRDPDGKQQTWYQTSVLPIVYVTDPYAILETTGHA
jgi:hypothetical protein